MLCISGRFECILLTMKLDSCTILVLMEGLIACQNFITDSRGNHKSRLYHRNGHPITSWITASTIHQNPIIMVTPNNLPPPEHPPLPPLQNLNLMPHILQSFNSLCTNTLLHKDCTIHILPGLRRCSCKADPGCIQRRLRVVLEC